MRTPPPVGLPFRPSLSFILLSLFALILWVAGGASRPDAMGQTVVRASAAMVLVALILFARRPVLGQARPVALFLAAAIMLTLLQLIPLPPAMWQALPGREPFAQLARLAGEEQPWRPLSLVPGATVNAVASLIVPLAMLGALLGLTGSETRRLPALLLGLVAASTVVGLLQFSGGGVDNPLINEQAAQVAGIFANRNHFALFTAIGCLLVPIWVFDHGHQNAWRGPAGIGLVALFALTILASGSRAGMLVGVVALVLGLAIVQRDLRRSLRRYPPWVFFAATAAIIALIAALVMLSFAADRAVSINRLVANDIGNDVRTRALPTVMTMIQTYLPTGSGFGGFDPIFRMHEPFDLLKPTYFNHAHDDWLEIVLDGGIPALLLLIAALAWWGWMSFRAWFGGGDPEKASRARLGSAVLLLVFLASAFDYPARTPMIMAVIVVAASWLASARPAAAQAALPADGQHL